jgi:thiol-disulfide isomerase/thioredoxin
MHSGQLSQGPPFYTTDVVQKIAGRSFANQTEYASWVLNMSPEQSIQLALANSDSHSGGYRPNELICFRDHREVAPDVWVPFREDRAFTHPVAGRPGRRKYIRLWAAVQKVRTDFELSETIARLEPKDGDRVGQDQRFGLPAGYEYRADRTPREMLELVAAERQTPAMQGFLGSLTWPIENQVGRAAPELPAVGWIGSPPARLAGKPYLVHFWANWSDSCKDDFPALKDLAAEGVTIIGIHPAGTPAGDVKKAAEEARLNFPTLLAVENAPRHFDQRIAGFPVWMFPYYVLVDSQGKVAAHGSLSPELIARFRALSSEKSEEQSK